LGFSPAADFIALFATKPISSETSKAERRSIGGYYQQLDALRVLRQQVRCDLLALLFVSMASAGFLLLNFSLSDRTEIPYVQPMPGGQPVPEGSLRSVQTNARTPASSTTISSATSTTARTAYQPNWQ
jgi:hypothetical protein